MLLTITYTIILHFAYLVQLVIEETARFIMNASQKNNKANLTKNKENLMNRIWSILELTNWVMKSVLFHRDQFK